MMAELGIGRSSIIWNSSRPFGLFIYKYGCFLFCRKSLDVSHVVEANRTAGLVVEAVNRHVGETHAQTNGANDAQPPNEGNV